MRRFSTPPGKWRSACRIVRFSRAGTVRLESRTSSPSLLGANRLRSDCGRVGLASPSALRFATKSSRRCPRRPPPGRYVRSAVAMTSSTATAEKLLPTTGTRSGSAHPFLISMYRIGPPTDRLRRTRRGDPTAHRGVRGFPSPGRLAPSRRSTDRECPITLLRGDLGPPRAADRRNVPPPHRRAARHSSASKSKSRALWNSPRPTPTQSTRPASR